MAGKYLIHDNEYYLHLVNSFTKNYKCLLDSIVIFYLFRKNSHRYLNLVVFRKDSIKFIIIVVLKLVVRELIHQEIN